MNEHAFRKFTAARRPGSETNINQIRLERNRALARTDWTQVPDSPLSPEKKQEWALYRQALRDLTESGDVNNIVWPQEP
jgi:hypothetical protein